MKLHSDTPDTQSITAYGEGWIAVNGQRHAGSLVLASGGQLLPWDCQRFEDLSAAHFEGLVNVMEDPPELVVFGSGARCASCGPPCCKA